MKVVNKILKQLTPERIEKEIKAIQKIKLPPELKKWIKEYEKVGERDEFIWKWLYKMNEKAAFFKIQSDYHKRLWKVKVLFNMFIILLDDVAEEERERLLKLLLKIPFEAKYIKSTNLSVKDKKYLNFTKKIWREIEKNAQKFPRYKQYKTIFEYDVHQFINEVRYAYLIYRSPAFMNELEYWMYLPQGMQIVIDFDLDLMCALHQINEEEIGITRETVLILQRMGRVGNWVSTWEREVQKRDFTAGVFPYAVISSDVVTVRDLLKGEKDKTIEKIKNAQAERHLLKKWEEDYREIEGRSNRIKFVDIEKTLKKFEELLFMHLISRGLK